MLSIKYTEAFVVNKKSPSVAHPQKTFRLDVVVLGIVGLLYHMGEMP